MKKRYPSNFSDIKNTYAIDNDLFYNLKTGTVILKSENELNQYLYSYGNMHLAKLKETYSNFFTDSCFNTNDVIDIIDYGCGQGIASIVLLNLLEKKNFKIENISKITLIEPSLVALNRAERLLHNSAIISKVNKKLDDIVSSDIKSNNTTLHLFSNILDMGDTYFDMQKLADKIIRSKYKKAYFICVSPYNEDKLKKFMNFFKDEHSFQEIKDFIGEEKAKNWKIVYRIFKIGD